MSIDINDLRSEVLKARIREAVRERDLEVTRIRRLCALRVMTAKKVRDRDIDTAHRNCDWTILSWIKGREEGKSDEDHNNNRTDACPRPQTD